MNEPINMSRNGREASAARMLPGVYGWGRELSDERGVLSGMWAFASVSRLQVLHKFPAPVAAH